MIMTPKELRAHFDKRGGRIELETHGNFVLPGFEDIHANMAAARMAAAAPRAKAAEENDVTVNLRLALRNRVDNNIPASTTGQVPVSPTTTGYYSLDRVPVLNSQEGVPATYGGRFTDPGPSYNLTEYWLTKSFAISQPTSAFLLDVINAIGGVASSFINNVQTAASVNLKSLNFGTNPANPFNNDDGYFDLEEDPESGEYKGRWVGWSWMYFIGSPQNRITGQPQPHGQSGLPDTAYPGLTLGEYDVARLLSYHGQQVDGNAFTLSYEKTAVTFDNWPTTENGETVHKIKCSHIAL